MGVTLGLAVFGAIVASAFAAPAPHLDPIAQVLSFPNASGPPVLSCKAARAAASPHPEKPKGRTSSTTPPKPDPTGMPVLMVDGSERAVAQLPGSALDQIPPRALEGTPEVLAQIGALMRRGVAGEPVRLSFFGASHVGADFWTGHIRRLLQDRWGDRGHGFVLPAALYSGYRGNDVNLCRTDGWLSDWSGKANGHRDGRLGFAGMSVSSSNAADFGWVETTKTNPHGQAVGWFDVYYLAQPSGGGLELSVDDQPAQVISTAAGAAGLERVRVRVTDGRHRLVLSPVGDGEVRLFGVSMEREGPGVVVDAMGIRGRQAKTWVDWDPPLAQAGLKLLDPDLVVLAYGTNEAADQRYTMTAYEADLRVVLSQLRSRLPASVPCVLVGPSDRGFRLKKDENRFAVWDRTAPVAAVQRDVAGDFNCAFWDWQAATGGPGSMVAWRFVEPALAAPDLIHHTLAGYRWVAEAFVAALDATTGGAPR
jgi:lysophospholipase L1-like esterase